MKKVLDDYYGFNLTRYWYGFSGEIRYFSNLETLWLAVAMKVFVAMNFKKVTKTKSKLFMVSNFFTLLFVVALFFIPNADTGIFTRYYIYLQPVLTCIALFDFIFLLKLFSGIPQKTRNNKVYLLVAVFTLLFGYTFAENFPHINGHIYEMTHPFKGPLDYTIPYLRSHYDKPEDLIIATNYEETSYMYYLNSKVIVGYVGNNLHDDTLCQPVVLAYRQTKASPFKNEIFYQFTTRAQYSKIDFPCKDITTNSTPELNFDNPDYNHYFKSMTPGNESEAVYLGIRM